MDFQLIPNSNYQLCTNCPHVYHEVVYLGFVPKDDATVEMHYFKGRLGVYGVKKNDLYCRVKEIGIKKK